MPSTDTAGSVLGEVWGWLFIIVRPINLVISVFFNVNATMLLNKIGIFKQRYIYIIWN